MRRMRVYFVQAVNVCLGWLDGLYSQRPFLPLCGRLQSYIPYVAVGLASAFTCLDSAEWKDFFRSDLPTPKIGVGTNDEGIVMVAGYPWRGLLLHPRTWRS